MGVDWIPGICQLKSVVQLLTLDVDGALQTQANFVQECPVVSQVTSTVQWVAGDSEGAIETQMKCLNTVSNFANGVPVVGHVKSGVHYLCGDTEGASQAFNSATRSSVVLGTAVGAGMVSGGLAAIPAAIAAGGTYDIAGTIITEKPQGYIAALDQVAKNPSGGTVFDALMVPVGDGLAGYSGGKMGENMATAAKVNNLQSTLDVKSQQLDAGMFGKDGVSGDMTSGQVASLGQEVMSLHKQLEAIKPRVEPQYFHDLKTNTIVVEPATAGGSAVPVVIAPQANESTPNVERPSVAHTTQVEPIFLENGFEAAEYTESTRTNEEKKKVVADRMGEKPTWNLTRAFRNVNLISQSNVGGVTNASPDQKPPTQSQRIEVLSTQELVYIHMPKEFNYTTTTVTNSHRQGLLHFFLRHGDQYRQFIPAVDTLMTSLESNTTIGNHLRNIRTGSPVAAEAAAIAFMAYLDGLSLDTQEEIRGVLNAIQREVHTFIQANVTFGQYQGEGVNENDHIQVYFEVTDFKGNKRIMVLCVSDQLYRPVTEGGRNIRTLTTVYFITPKQGASRRTTAYFRKPN